MRVQLPPSVWRKEEAFGEVIDSYTEHALPIKGHSCTREIVCVQMESGHLTWVLLKDCKEIPDT